MSLGVISGRQPCGLLLSFLLAAAGTLLAAPAPAQPPSNLNLLQPLAEDRAKVDVIWGPRREFARGKLLDVTDSALLLDGRKGRTEVPAADVLEVWSPGGPHYRKPVIVGSAIGLGLGLLAMAGDGDCNDPTSLCATDGPVTGSDVAIVTAVGAASGLGWAWWKRQPRHLLYLAPQPAAASIAVPEPRVPEAAAEPSAAANVEVRPDWLSLRALEGMTVEFAQRGSAVTLKGQMVAVTPEAIKVLVDGEPFVVRQREVSKVWREPRLGWWHVPVASLYLAIGPSILVSLAACTHLPDNEEAGCAGTTYGITAGVMGVLTSYAVARQRHDALAYDASRPVPASKSAFVVQPLLGRRAVGLSGAFTF
jgi:hypothetical protein